MRNIIITTLTYFAVASAAADSSPLVSNSFSTNAKFAVDNRSLSLSSAVATIEARPGSPGYSWVRVYFYSFSPTADDLTDIANGNVDSMDKKWTKLADKHDNSYNSSRAVIQLSVDKKFKVWQVDMSIPGRSCTIAPYEPDVRKFLQDYRFDGKILRLKSKGSYMCEHVGKFDWDINVETHVYAKK